MSLLVQSVYVFILAVILAFIEVQMEGPHGWAAKLPTWRPKPGGLIEKLKNKLRFKKPLTGYHIGLVLFLVTIIHLPYAWGVRWSPEAELLTLSFLFLWMYIEDFLWFILNPAFGIKKFKSEYIWWHDRWAIGVPVDYFIALILSLVAYWLIGTGLSGWFQMLGIFLSLTLATVIVVELVKSFKKESK